MELCGIWDPARLDPVGATDTKGVGFCILNQCHGCCSKSGLICRHLKRYSVLAITLLYVFALLHNASTLKRKVMASYSYRPRLIKIIITSYSNHSGLIGTIIT
jgi:hypothetical protein